MSINLNVGGNTQPLEAAVQAAVSRIRKTPIKITVDDKGATQPLGNMKRSADEFSKSMEAANARIIAFGASMAIMNGVSNAFKSMVRDLVEVEKALADINVVMNLSAQNLDKFSSGLFRVAKETGAAFNIAAVAATEYARQGLGVEESLKRTRDALILTRLTGMDSAEAVKALTAAMNTYGSQIKDTTELVSKFAAVDVKFAVSAEDFADAIARTGQAAKSAGVDIDELIGLVTAAQQQTARGGKVIGNSFKTIFTRVGRTTTLNQLESMGIAVRDLQGNTLGATRILTDLANTFDKLSAAQQAQIAQTVGGVFQINILKAVLSDAAKQNSILADATKISSNATDDAIRKNEQLRQTMAAMASETGMALKEVSSKIGEIMLAPGMEKILNMVKGVAEGVNNMLGDGEDGGNKFAKGFLTGIGNIITGPGLVVMTAVFGKLLFRAFQYARDSLKSLVGITSEAQKQKAIQTSLLGLFSRNTELNKEMLRTDISRTQKEQTILNLLKAQVAEASILQSVSARSAQMLQRQGYNSGLTPRRGKADGHIPNFSERAQAAKGGYAAGTIRTMNMPGQGGVIYNSAETVKSFPGLKQPAIMPPRGSSAGKDYQKGFAGAHGFDPYAARGYIPNFNKGGAKQVAGTSPKGVLDLTKEFTMLTLAEGSSGTTGLGTAPAGLYGMGALSKRQIKFGVGSLDRAKIKNRGNGRAGIGGLKQMVEGITKYSSGLGANFGNGLMLGKNQADGNPSPSNVGEVKRLLGKSSGGALGAISGVAGSIFEAGILSRFSGSRKGPGGANLEDSSASEILEWVGDKGATKSLGLGGDFDARHLNRFPAVKQLFKGNTVADIGDYKTAQNPKTQKSMAHKIMKELIFRKDPRVLGTRKNYKKHGFYQKEGNIFMGSEKDYQQNMGVRTNRIPATMKTTGWRTGAAGFVPNFANPLSDAIGRERSAGVPVSQIRVGAHSALAGKGNPGGLGVTNTKDEPNGLRDVFGAKGFVPNYAIKDFLSGIGGGSAKEQEYNDEIDRWTKAKAKSRQAIERELKDQKKAGVVVKGWEKAKKKELSIIRNSNNSTKQRQQAVARLNKINTRLATRTTELEKATRRLAGARTASAAQEKRLGGAQSRAKGGRLGGKMGGNMGLVAMMGLPMLQAQLQSGGAEQGGAGYIAGGAAGGAATGGMMAMMVAPFFGPAAPLVIGVGALAGAVWGGASASKENTEALRKSALAQKEAQSAAQAASRQTLSTLFASNKTGERSIVNTMGGGSDDFPFRVNQSGIGGFSQGTYGFTDLNRSMRDQFSELRSNFRISKSEMATLGSGKVPEGVASRMGISSKFNTAETAKEIESAYKAGEFHTLLSKDEAGRSNDGGEIGAYKRLFFARKAQADDPRNKNKGLNNAKTLSGLAQDDLALIRKEMIKSLSFNEDSTEKVSGGEAFKDLFGKESATWKEINEAVDKMKPGEVAQLFNAIGDIMDKNSALFEKQRVAAIKQLDMQIVQLSIQKQINSELMGIKDKYATMAANLSGSLGGAGITDDLSKANMKYVGAINKASQALEVGRANADFARTKGIIDKLSTGTHSTELKSIFSNDKSVDQVKGLTEGFKSALKTSLQSKPGPGGVKKINLTEAFQAAMTKQDMEAIVSHLGSSAFSGTKSTEMDKIMRAENLKREIAMDKVDSTYNTEVKIAELNKIMGIYLGQRVESYKEMERISKNLSAELERQNTLEGMGNKTAELTAKNANPYASGNEALRMQMNVKGRAFGTSQKVDQTANAKQLIDSYKGLEKYGLSALTPEQTTRAMKGDLGAVDPTAATSDKARAQAKLRLAENFNQMKSFQGPFRPEGQKAHDEKLRSMGNIVGAGDEFRKYLIDAEVKNLEEQKKFFGDQSEEKQKQHNQEMKAIQLRLSGGGFAGGMGKAASEIKTSTEMFEHNLGYSIPTTFRDSMVGAMRAAIQEGEGLKDVLLGAANSFLTVMQNIFMENAANMMMRGMFPGMMSAGGSVKGYSQGGGVPARISNGEYVMGSKAVSRYGGGFMHSLNARGKIPGYASGGPQRGSAISANFGGGESYNSGRLYQSKAMSGSFYAGDNIGLGEDASESKRIISERIAAAKAKKAKRKKLLKNVLGVAIGFGMNYMMGGFGRAAGPGGGALGGGEALGGGAGLAGTAGGYTPGSNEAIFSGRSRSLLNAGGKVRKYAPGGFVSGTPGIDQIPAMLSEGEYVIKNSSVRQLGKPMLDRINAGKFNDGGPTTPLMEQSESSSGTGGSTNNINISVNIEGGGKQGEDSSVENPKEGSDKAEGNAELAQKIKAQVVNVIIEEQRPGGLLNR